MIKLILSTLLHHANRETKADEFYKIKDRILTRYGTVVGYDVQFIEGKKCHSCNGTGQFKKLNQYGFVYDIDSCWHCIRGWYKRPTWVLLQRIRFGKYIFHKPIEKKYGKANPFINECGVNKNAIDGYIDHSRTEYGKDALVILYLIYDWKGYWKRWYRSVGRGWYCHRSWWMSPRRCANNIAHIIRYKRKAIPFQRKQNYVLPSTPVAQQTEDLPF